MNDKDLHNLVRTLADIDVSAPTHQARLRAQLLTQHATQQTIVGRLFAAFAKISSTGVHMKKNTIVFGGSALAVGLLVAGVLSVGIMQAHPASAAQLAESATKKAQQMSAEEVARINAQYHQDLARRLNEAKQDKDLRVLPRDEVVSWGWAVKGDDPDVSKYLTYTDSSNHRIIIALGSDDQPVYIVDFDAVQAQKASPANSATEPDTNGIRPTGYAH